MAPKKARSGTAKNPRQQNSRPLDRDLPATQQPEGAVLPLELQQATLDVFRHAFPVVQDDLHKVIQEVKGHLYRRDFASAFGSQHYLEAYALRWSASRALGYAEIFLNLCENTTLEKELASPATILCLGGGAGAEVVALAATARQLSLPILKVVAIDIADWSQCLTQLAASARTPPSLPSYVSEAVKEANRALVADDQLDVTFVRHDVLALKEDVLGEIVDLSQVKMCTLMFTLNELFTSSIAKTTAFLLALTDQLQLGSFLVVVDSPGSYSEVQLGQDGRTRLYPMKWLLDHTLLEIASEDANSRKKWVKIVSHDSVWFRVDSRLKYPLELENMRYQMHVYERQGRSTT